MDAGLGHYLVKGLLGTNLPSQQAGTSLLDRFNSALGTYSSTEHCVNSVLYRLWNSRQINRITYKSTYNTGDSNNDLKFSVFNNTYDTIVDNIMYFKSGDTLTTTVTVGSVYIYLEDEFGECEVIISTQSETVWTAPCDCIIHAYACKFQS